VISASASFGEGRRRRRREVYWRLARFFLSFLAVVVIGVYGYQIGVAAGQARSAQLEADLERFQQDNLDLRDRLAGTLESSSRAEQDLEALRRRYTAEVPHGEIAELLGQVQEQLHAGVDLERLAFLIDAAGQAVRCEGGPVSKRFAPRTPVTQGPVSAVRFADRIVVTGTGQAALSADGLPEAWFDPAKPVQVEFRTLDGQAVQIEGLLPLTHAMVVDGQEYRFSLIAATAPFVEVAAQACAFP
jgi:hypothetical protein